MTNYIQKLCINNFPQLFQDFDQQNNTVCYPNMCKKKYNFLLAQ